MHAFSNIRALIIDMDGVLWHGNRPIAGLGDFFNALREKKLPFILATNNSMSTQTQYVKKLANMGVTVEKKEVLTSSMVTAFYLSKQYQAEKTKVFVIGEEGLKAPLLEQGFILTNLDEINADLVVCGLDKQLNWDKLSTATLNIRAGAKFIATNGDFTLPTERGLVPGNGATLAALKAATDVSPKCIGKPEPIMYQQAMSLLGAEISETIAIGDRLDTDILGAVRTGIRSLMVLTGVSSREDLKELEYQPTWIMDDIEAVTQALKNL